MYLLNAWYVAGWSDEFTAKLFKDKGGSKA